jgi:hypothetical protein
LAVGLVEQVFSETYWILFIFAVMMLCVPKPTENEKHAGEYIKVEKFINKDIKFNKFSKKHKN